MRMILWGYYEITKIFNEKQAEEYSKHFCRFFFERNGNGNEKGDQRSRQTGKRRPKIPGGKNQPT